MSDISKSIQLAIGMLSNTIDTAELLEIGDCIEIETPDDFRATARCLPTPNHLIIRGAPPLLMATNIYDPNGRDVSGTIHSFPPPFSSLPSFFLPRRKTHD